MPRKDRDDELAKVIGRAVIDKNFAAQLVRDPAAAGRAVGAELDQDQIEALRDLAPDQLRAAGDIITDQLSELAFVDQQQQQQQQAQAD